MQARVIQETVTLEKMTVLRMHESVLMHRKGYPSLQYSSLYAVTKVIWESHTR